MVMDPVLQQEQKAEIGYLVAKAQEGDKQAREQLLRDYRPFYLRVASGSAKKYLVLGRDDEASIAMMAFNEAISAYNSNAGASFLSFAEMVIKRRMVDYYRKRSSKHSEIPLSSFEDDDNEVGTINRIELRNALYEQQRQREGEEYREEIFRLNQMLSDYGISFSELVKISPKHEDARRRALEVARTMAEDEKLKEYLLKRRALPLKALQERVSVSRKTLERQRKYIITLTLILIGEFYFLQEYLKKV